jgi:hypothetical protein
MKSFLIGIAIFCMLFVVPIMFIASDPDQKLRVEACYKVCGAEIKGDIMEDPDPEQIAYINTNGGGIRCGCSNERTYYITGKGEVSETTDSWFFK